jgi:hypothetical protein
LEKGSEFSFVSSVQIPNATSRLSMRVWRDGITKLFSYLRAARLRLEASFLHVKSRGTRFILSGSLLMMAAAATGFARGNAQSAALTPVSSSQPSAMAAKPGDAAADGPNQDVADADIERLLQMATELKAEVEKSNQDELSISVIRKASAIEQLAHKVRTGKPGK